MRSQQIGNLSRGIVKEIKRFFYTGSADCRLSAVDFGNPDKPDVLIVHGMRDHAMSMFSLAEALSDNYHVIAMDM
ncbi:MAG: hypothetical protein KUG75_01920, partial [Pseudomonadales bacterium]|nr:hypothetical protein [Pseudomonadales bacterium]